MRIFADRQDAGRQLAAALSEDDAVLGGRVAADSTVVVGLPRGGVPVAAEVARQLDAPLDVLIVRKVGAPGHEELALGAVGEENAVARNDDLIRASGISESDLARREQTQRDEVRRRAAMFRPDRQPVGLSGRTVIIVDDGIATGATMRAACAVARARAAARIVVAVPVAAPDVLGRLDADAVVCLHSPRDFMAVGMHYVDFRQTSDSEVIALLS
ncbi:phosphoribosyltransferase [Microbacterium esteraromaticum]|uniref:phosphoribosyltransferase n=1 Tax=Microbacterium esteraromaticum TaxID=57043 RepID=UPI0019D3DF8C|nr:phosphoribosyltransferase family protein [Microbacterium esteraromaticum]MBN7794381.1 phosphoribosyltransferase [Microbacterium esteraromaticum]